MEKFISCSDNDINKRYIKILTYIKDNPGCKVKELPDFGYYGDSGNARCIIRLKNNKLVNIVKVNNFGIRNGYLINTYYITELGLKKLESGFIYKRGDLFNKFGILDIQLTEEQKEILIGSLLGDGSISMGKLNARFGLSRTIKDIKYFRWHIDKFKNLCTNIDFEAKRIRECVSKFPNGREVYCKSCSFATRDLASLTEYRKLWYTGPNKIKMIPKNFELTSLIVAVWFADDGFVCASKRRKSYTCGFCTNSFTKEDVEYLIDKLNKFTGAEFYISKRGVGKRSKERQYQIAGNTIAYMKLIEKIKPYLVDMGMERKIIEINYKNNIKFIKFKKLLTIIKDNPNINTNDLFIQLPEYKEKTALLDMVKIFNKNRIINISKQNINVPLQKQQNCYYLTEYGLKCLEDDTFYNPFYYNRKGKYKQIDNKQCYK